jgi:hypothetical protein
MYPDPRSLSLGWNKPRRQHSQSFLEMAVYRASNKEPEENHWTGTKKADRCYYIIDPKDHQIISYPQVAKIPFNL